MRQLVLIDFDTGQEVEVALDLDDFKKDEHGDYVNEIERIQLAEAVEAALKEMDNA